MDHEHNADERSHPRSPFAQPHLRGGSVQVSHVQPLEDPQAIPALVVNLSEGGLQVLSTASLTPQGTRYALELLPEKAGSAPPRTRLEVHRVWSRPDGMNIKSGFAFRVQAGSIAELLQQHAAKGPSILRCVLHPLE
jgi:hypothetical protein